MKHCILLFLIVLVVGVAHHNASAQSPSFTYQGQLRLSGEPFTGMVDLEFRLYDQLSAGTEIGSAQLRPDWPVEDGLFQVELDFGSNAFDGNDRFLEVLVDGAALIPRQKVTATPYALLATGLASGSVGGSEIDPTEVQLRVVGTCPAGEYVREVNQDGSVVCGVDALGNDWRLGGNAGTNPATDFLGTTDATPLEIRTANARSLRIEPSAELFEGLPITANIIAGSSANEVAAGVRGATIGGGGVPAGSDDPDTSLEAPNQINDHYGVIGGGYGNTVGDPTDASDEAFATIGGGLINTASGDRSTVGGGFGNKASDFGSTVGGGRSNTASGDRSTVGGGSINTASGTQSTVGGGSGNTASEFRSTVGGGSGNTASGSDSTVGGGRINRARGVRSTVGGGVFNTASGDRSTVGGGSANTASGSDSTVGGGDFNCAGGSFSWAGGRRATVRPGSDSGESGSGCDSVSLSGDADGDEGTFIWADSENADFVSTGPDQFLVRAAGGIAFGRTPDDYFEIQTPFDQVTGNGAGEQGALRVRLNGTTRFRLLGNGGLGIGNSYSGSGVPENGLRVNGLVQLDSLGSAGSTQLCQNSADQIATCSSSARYKRDIAALDLGLEAVLALQPVGYRWKTDGSADIGFVAEDVAAIDERLITRNAAGEIEGVRYDRISSVLANAVHEMHDRDQRSDAALQALTGENSALRARLAEVEARHEARFEAIQRQQDQELDAMRRELAMLRELVAPRVAQDAR